jgi:hypothetical protein
MARDKKTLCVFVSGCRMARQQERGDEKKVVLPRWGQPLMYG